MSNLFSRINSALNNFFNVDFEHNNGEFLFKVGDVVQLKETCELYKENEGNNIFVVTKTQQNCVFLEPPEANSQFDMKIELLVGYEDIEYA